MNRDHLRAQRGDLFALGTRCLLCRLQGDGLTLQLGSMLFAFLAQ